MPDIVHSHYADAGYVGVRLANLGDIPLVHTGHSLGRDKRKRLLARGLSSEDIETTYNMTRRIDAEEEVLANADLVITSTHNEIETQYGLYNYYDPDRMTVIPPGTDLSRFSLRPMRTRSTFGSAWNPSFPIRTNRWSWPCRGRTNAKTFPYCWMLLVNRESLRETANLLIIAGNRDDIRDLESGARSVHDRPPAVDGQL